MGCEPEFARSQVKEGLDVGEVGDFMRGLGFYPSDYQIDCLQHELAVSGRRRVPFEELVKLFINHSQAASAADQPGSLESSIRTALILQPHQQCDEIYVDKSQLVSLLSEKAERAEVKDAEMYLRELYRGESRLSLATLVSQLCANSNNT